MTEPGINHIAFYELGCHTGSLLPHSFIKEVTKPSPRFVGKGSRLHFYMGNGKVLEEHVGLEISLWLFLENIIFHGLEETLVW